MALKFRRGTTAQQSGSLAFGEPYVNTTLGTLVVGGQSGDIVLSTSGTGSTGNFGAISGSGLDITGNANIAGNVTVGGKLTIGDATSDTVNVVASLSSSLIPQTDNTFDLGSETKSWRDLYISTGSIKVVANGAVVSTLSTNADGSQNFPNGLRVSGSFVVSGSTRITNGLIIGTTGSVQAVTNYPNALTINGNTAGTYGGGIFLSRASAAQWGIISDNTDDLTISNNNSFSTRKVKIYDSADKIEFTYSGSETDFGAGFHNIRFDGNAIIPGQTSHYDLGSETNIWRDLYISTGSIKFVDGSGTQVGTLTATSLNAGTQSVNELNAWSASAKIELSNLELTTASLNTSVSNLNSFSSSQLGKDATLATLTASYDGRFTTLGTYTGSVEGRFSTLATLTGSNATRLSNLETTSASVNTSITNLNSTTASLIVDTNNLEIWSASVNTSVSNLNTTTGSLNTSVSNINTFTASLSTTSNVRFGSLGIGMAASGTSGRIDAAGDIVAFSTSDRNFKENITPIPNAIEKIRKISGNTYDWKAELKDIHGFEGNDVGVIAQEIEEVLPQLVTTRETGYKAVKYDKLVALLIEGIKEQQQHIDNLTIQVEELKKAKGL